MARRRLDAELVRRGLARSREHARTLIESGSVLVAGTVASKAATQVDAAEAVLVRAPDDSPHYVSRGAHKLLGALEEFGIDVHGRSCLDAGASTGGFTDVLLRRGAARVVCVDVGYGQLAWEVSTNDRVTVMDRTNIRDVGIEQLPFRPDLVVADLSFISLTLVLPSITSIVDPMGDLLLMVKPQFEVGKESIGSRGVVRDPHLRAAAVAQVAEAAHAVGWQMDGVVASPLPGPAGNVEYFVWLKRGTNPVDRTAIDDAIAKGPQ